MKILILGAAGQVPSRLTKLLLQETESNLVLYARDAEKRLKKEYTDREEIVSGDFLDSTSLNRAMQVLDLVYLNDMGNA